jgi:hypothetical protein
MHIIKERIEQKANSKTATERKYSTPAYHRVGGGVTPAVLPRHRTYGSVYGGSFNTLEAQPGVQQRDQT